MPFRFSTSRVAINGHGARIHRLLTTATATSTPPAAPVRTATDVAGVVVFSALTALTAGLGTWQLVRYQWKRDLLSARSAAVAEDVSDLSSGPLPPALTTSEGAYRRVRVSGGSFASNAPVAVLDPRVAPPGLPTYLLTSANAGRQLVVPLTRRDGTRILALTGWVPSNVELPVGHVLPSSALSNGPASARALRGDLEGVIRISEVPGRWSVVHTSGGSYTGSASSPATPPKDASSGSGGASASGSGGMTRSKAQYEYAGGHVFSSLDIPALADACGLDASKGDVTDALIEVVLPFPPASAPVQDRWPVTRQSPEFTATITPLTHLVYAATWLSLAACGTVLTRNRFRGGSRAGGGARRRVISNSSR